MFSVGPFFNLTISLFCKFGTNYNWPLDGAATHKGWVKVHSTKILILRSKILKLLNILQGPE